MMMLVALCTQCELLVSRRRGSLCHHLRLFRPTSNTLNSLRFSLLGSVHGFSILDNILCLCTVQTSNVKSQGHFRCILFKKELLWATLD